MAVKRSGDIADRLARAEAQLRELGMVLHDAHELASGYRAASSGAVDAVDEATTAFAEELAVLLGQVPPLTAAVAREVGRRAALVAASECIWDNELGPSYGTAEVRELLSGVSRQRVSELVAARRLIALDERAGARRFPAFQFHDGRPLVPLIRSFWVVNESAVSPWSAAAWCVAPDPALDGLSPLAWARQGRDADRLAEIARQDAARLAW